MAPANAKNTSSIALALAGKTDSVDIPKPRNAGFWMGKESFAAVAAKSVPAGKHATGLPTPPNSISPSLPPQGYKGHAVAAPPTPPAPVHVDSDLDLQDAVDHAKAQDRPLHGLSKTLVDLDAAGTITPGLLAKHHLPGILLEHGPLAIRHVMGFLTTSVPGFSGIPPAKARRLVVGALEGRGNETPHRGIKEDVIFEKVGWGRWDARRRGEPARNRKSDHTSNGLQIPGNNSRQDHSRRLFSSTSMGRESAAYSHDSEMDYDHADVDLPEHEADKMSLDDGESCSSSEPPDDIPMQPDDLGDITDEEDWASIGAAALRQASFPLTGGSRIFNNNLYPSRPDPRSWGRGVRPPTSKLGKSVPITSYALAMKDCYHKAEPGARHQQYQDVPAGPDGTFDNNDREAVEALLSLGSM